MKRRDFIATTGIASILPYVPTISRPSEDAPLYKMGYQLFSIRDRMATEPIKTLQALKSFGYQDFEIYGYDDKTDNIYGMSPQALKDQLDREAITATSGHYGFSDYLLKSDSEVKSFVDRCLTCAHTLGSTYITWPWLAPEYRTFENFKILVQKLNIIASHMKGSGIEFAYHNHGFEFEVKDGDKTGYDLILTETDPELVKLQMDMYWVFHSAQITPQKLVADHLGRYVMWHIKDMDALTRDYTEVGNGSINYLNVLPTAKDSGLQYYYIEQGGNFAVNSLESARVSAMYCKKHLVGVIG